MTTLQLHHQTLDTVKTQSTRLEELDDSKLDGVVSFNYRVRMISFRLYH